MLTQAQIVAKIESSTSFFGFDVEVYAMFLDYDHAKYLLKEDARAKVKKAEWNKNVVSLTEDNVKAEMKDYMSFAIGKALDHRGISASRSVEKMQAYCAILEIGNQIHWEWYAQYGAPILKEICDMMGWQAMYTTDLTYGVEQFARMADGKRCSDDCMEGCGT